MRYIVFGDSISLGKTDWENGGWVSLLKKEFDPRYKDNSVLNVSIGNNTSKDILDRFDDDSKRRLQYLSKTYHCLILAVGLNDSRKFKGEYEFSLEDFRENIDEILKRSVNYFSKFIVIGLTQVDESKTQPFKLGRYYDNSSIEKYNKVLKECAEKFNCKFVDLFNFFDNEENYSDDGLHPNTKGHKLIYEYVSGLLK